MVSGTVFIVGFFRLFRFAPAGPDIPRRLLSFLLHEKYENLKEGERKRERGREREKERGGSEIG